MLHLPTICARKPTRERGRKNNNKFPVSRVRVQMRSSLRFRCCSCNVSHRIVASRVDCDSPKGAALAFFTLAICCCCCCYAGCSSCCCSQFKSTRAQFGLRAHERTRVDKLINKAIESERRKLCAAATAAASWSANAIIIIVIIIVSCRRRRNCDLIASARTRARAASSIR